MTKPRILTLLLHLTLASVLLVTGCTPSYNAERIAKAGADARIQQINHKAELAAKQHEMRLLAAEIVNDTQKLLQQANIKLTKDADIMAANYKAVDSLIKKLPAKPPKDQPILVASFVNIDDLAQSSTFGRLVSEHFASRFNQKGYATIELKLRTTVFLKKGSGEFVLSREIGEIGLKHSAQAVIVGTYAVASDRVYVTARVVNVQDNRILSSYDYSVPVGRDTFKMLLKGKGQESLDWL